MHFRKMLLQNLLMLHIVVHRRDAQPVAREDAEPDAWLAGVQLYAFGIVSSIFSALASPRGGID